MTVAFADWQSYTWKNELALHGPRVVKCMVELADDEYDGDHNPHHMLERALNLSAFCIRRMHEKRLVTDSFREEKISVRSFAALLGPDFVQPFLGSSGGAVFGNYDLAEPVNVHLGRDDVANQIIHSSQLMVCYREKNIEDGLLIASDRGQRVRLLHMTATEWTAYYASVLDNNIRVSSDSRDPLTGKVDSSRG